MGLKVGIVGLPNVGKSTLFNAITNSSVEAANYPFATIEPNVGVVEVPDKRLDKVSEIFNSKKTIYTTIDFVDIAGLIAGASKGEGLGNAFLSNIRETDLICHVVRCFDSSDITHVNGLVDPISDAEVIELELILADEAIVDKRLSKLLPKYKSSDKEAVQEYNVLDKIKKQLSSGKFANELNLDEEELKPIKSLNLITLKKFVFVGNVTEDLINKDNEHFLKLKEYSLMKNYPIIKICAKIEEELSILEPEEKEVFYNDYNIENSGLDLLIRTAYESLNLRTYFTAGPQEARAWQFVEGMTAPECAGIIHTDFQKGFIKADVYDVNDLFDYPNETELKNAGKIRLEGKNYLVKDGDVCFFKFNN